MLARADGTALAYRHVAGATPTIVFLPGYMSDMAGSKAEAVLQWAADNGQACLLLDYAGCGRSGGNFADQTLESWRDDVMTVANSVAPGPRILIGSSMGGWLMLLAARAWQQAGYDSAVAALVGIAAAPDFTEWGFNEAEKALIHIDGRLEQASDYSDQPYLTTRAFWQSGQDNRLLGGAIPLSCPVRLLHGQADDDVPWDISIKLAAALTGDDVRITLVKDGDHRLSRPQDIALLLATLGELVHTAGS
jgi:pimeloyl-ACP methyl ester carboxylesterase